MIIKVSADRTVTLVAPDDTRSFKVAASSGLSRADLTDALKGIADVTSADDAWVSEQWIREHSGLSQSADWSIAFGKMLDYARAKDWLRSEDRAIRAHVERE